MATTQPDRETLKAFFKAWHRLPPEEQHKMLDFLNKRYGATPAPLLVVR